MGGGTRRIADGECDQIAPGQLTLIRMFEELRGRGYDGGYDAVRRCVRGGAKSGQSRAATYVPLST
jgi:hypothetical protein